jgi:hypothetical protein
VLVALAGLLAVHVWRAATAPEAAARHYLAALKADDPQRAYALECAATQAELGEQGQAQLMNRSNAMYGPFLSLHTDGVITSTGGHSVVTYSYVRTGGSGSAELLMQYLGGRWLVCGEQPLSWTPKAG